jgi:hypothetical protein
MWALLGNQALLMSLLLTPSKPPPCIQLSA